ncbi:unique cartilage matrix-associated protein isoform X2 [Balaenoptera acutorostrata]|uniref:Unique cartilage matrix-associated protein n=1 Tax=Balaenoptera acutorostrata TaxID=9767 RepID=A0A384ARG6_BALAC|nr:unique cartilage matrix-associated protein isoform X2 [Balaenoptera acutorostrata]
MAWRQLFLISCLSAVVLLSILREGTAVSVGTRRLAGQEVQEGVEEKIFMQESDALNFLKKRAEKRLKLQADELWREHHEEQRNEFENFVEEQNDEHAERSREAIEQWRQWHNDGLYPSYLYNRHHI